MYKLLDYRGSRSLVVFGRETVITGAPERRYRGFSGLFSGFVCFALRRAAEKEYENFRIDLSASF